MTRHERLRKVFGKAIVELPNFGQLYRKAIGMSRTTYYRHRDELTPNELIIIELLETLPKESWPERWKALK